MKSLIYFLLISGIYLSKLLLVNTKSQICGYSGDSFLCCRGYKKDNFEECTIPICENDCGLDGECIRPDTCYCSDGRVSISCVDEARLENDDTQKIKEIQGRCNNDCNGQGECVNGKCQCHWGYSGGSCLEKLIDYCYLSLSRGICQKLDNEIKTDVALCCNAFDVAWGNPCQKCQRSRCMKGFKDVDGICQDINECTIQGICRNGRCQNLEGSYKCLCTTGYQFDSNEGDCVKIKDVCKYHSLLCGTGMRCLTLPMGKYSCECRQGYTKSIDQKSCVFNVPNYFNFCTLYGNYVCQFGKCKPDGNNYKCECNPGYGPSGDYKSCKKTIDYCALYPNVLCPNGICISIADDYMCKCDYGYSPSFNRKKCTSVCDLYPNTLCPNAKCIPQPGRGYECRCNEGYSPIGKGKECRRIMNDQSASLSNLMSNSDSPTSYDVDYCSYDYYKRQCNGGLCRNKKNYYQCECLNGYIADKNGLACKKIDTPIYDQMLDMAGPMELKSYCDKYGSFLCANGHCIGYGSSYKCRCNSGFQESNDEKSCYDINECASVTNVCVQGTCTNSPGSYQCSCYDGFTIHYVPGGPKCYDRNECEEDQLLCTNGLCINKWGSYSCSCNAGYVISKDKKQCEPVQFLSVSKDALRYEKGCENCARSCTKINSTFYTCECPKGLSSVLNTGICVPMIKIINIRFDIKMPVMKRLKRAINQFRNVFFELVPGTDKSTFLKQVTSQYLSIVINQCDPINEPTRDGILCSFYNGASN